MALSISLATQIAAMFIMIIVGYFLIKREVISIRDSRVLSLLVLYVSCPAAIINAFQIELTPERLKGFVLAIVAGLAINCLYILLGQLTGRIFHFNDMERMSVIYSNCGNLIIPLVTLVLGPEMVFYCSGYMIVQTVLVWTHLNFVMSKSPSFNPRKIILNVNILAIIAGIFLCATQVTLPAMIQSSLTMMASIMAPVSMFVVGMLLAEMDLMEAFSNVRVYLVCFLRLIVFPLIVLAILILTGLPHIMNGADQILMISLLAASAPVASTVAQFAQLYGNHEFEAAQINSLSVILCIITMPLINMIYMALI